MNELEQIKKELATLQAKVAKMEQAKNEPTERWKPIKEEFYNSIFRDSIIVEYQFTDDTFDQNRIKFGNAFPKDMPLDDVVMMHQFINEMELICWQLGVRKPVSQLCPYLIGGKGEKICYKFDFIDQRDKAYSMLSYKVKDWLKTE
jgi:hypothetical protein